MIKPNDVSLVQLEQNDIVTPYEPYTESTQYLPNVGELRSLPNGTKDEISLSGQRVQRVSDDYLLLPNDVRGISPIDGINCADVQLPSSAIWQSPLNLSVNVEGYTNLKNVYSLGGRIGIPVSEGTTLEQAREQLVGTKLTYQLAEPIITPIQTSGNLISYPSGTVYIENVVADAGIYTTKFDIKELQLPIKSIDKLIKYSFETGVQTVLDTSLAAINEDKKSFTHPGLTDKDMVFVDYYYDVESTLGETTIEYYDSRHTIKDTANDKFYKWDIKSTNGVPTVALTEVL